jgi:hypothetical protein
MSNRGSRSGRMITISALVLAAWMAGMWVVAWRGLGRKQSKITGRLAEMFTGRSQQPRDSEEKPDEPTSLNDPRLSSLLLAADSWQRSRGSRRVVVDQVCLVPDMPAFLKAIALWDQRYYFPILIDEPAWTLPFLRAFRPARVVRYGGHSKPVASEALIDSSAPPAHGDEAWSQALGAVARAWSGPSDSELTPRVADRPPRWLGATPPGLVLTAPEAPMLAGAVALAAGHFQPLVRLHAIGEDPSIVGASARPQRFADVLSLAQAWRFARRVENSVASVIPDYDQLGDDCDFLTIAGDWPYRYTYDLGDEPIRGVYALDDLVGRLFEPASKAGWTGQMRRRWAYTGRLLGDAAASVARAMGALFLQPSSALLWNTYSGGRPWSDFTMRPVPAYLSRAIGAADAIVHRSGHDAGLANWHRAVGPVNRFGMVMFNSSGGPEQFAISGGVGRPSDIPRGLPSIVAMTHSFSAADPSNPQTIAGRWLSQGAFAYFGAVYEPFLLAFRTPGLVAALLAADVPFVAALRQGESETFGFPWRLMYLGDPLYRLQHAASTPDRSRDRDAVLAGNIARIPPDDWRKMASDYENSPVAEIIARNARSRQSERGRAFDSEDDRFRWCLDAAVGDLAGLPSDGLTIKTGGSFNARSTAFQTDGWHGVLMEIRRDRLGHKLRLFFDDLLIDALDGAGAVEELMARLAQIPLIERGPRVWQAIETCAMQRLVQIFADRDIAQGFVRAVDLWEEVIRLHWPQGSHFPSHVTERVAGLALGDPHRSRLWLDRLRKVGYAMAAEHGRSTHAAVIAAEQARVKAQLGGLGSSR